MLVKPLINEKSIIYRQRRYFNYRARRLPGRCIWKTDFLPQGFSIFLIIIIIPTLLHAVFLDSLLQLDSELDWVIILSSYVALIFLAILFVATSLCSSLLFKSQVASFLVAVLGCFIHFYFWSFLADLSQDLNFYNLINSFSKCTLIFN